MSDKQTYYKAQTARYFEMAEAARDFGVKGRLLEMADSWLRLVEEAEDCCGELRDLTPNA